MSHKGNRGFPSIVFGISPQGGNSHVEGDDVETQGVPLFYDPESDSYLSEQAIEEKDDRELTRHKALIAEDEEEFRKKAGFRP